MGFLYFLYVYRFALLFRNRFDKSDFGCSPYRAPASYCVTYVTE